MKQTTIEWLQSRVLHIVPSSQKDDLLKLFDQAKAMEKGQMEDVWHDSRVEDFGDDSKQESSNKTYKWFIKTKDFDKIPFFYSNTTNNPMNEIEGFDRESHWCIDFGSNIEVAEFYQIDPEDDSFVLIPKDEVIDIWCEETSNPKSVRKY